jgi:hypothetical protein
MREVGVALFGFWPICLVVVAVACAIWIGVRRRRQANVAKRDSTLRTRRSDAAPALVYTEAPTVRIGDSQRIDRLHRVVSLKEGAHADFLDLTFDRIPRLRVALVGVEHVAADDHKLAAQDYARIHVELGGAIAGCGALVKEVGANQFLAPCATQDEHRCSILHIYGKEDSVSFLRIKVLSLNTAEHSADVDVLHVCGQWAA